MKWRLVGIRSQSLIDSRMSFVEFIGPRVESQHSVQSVEVRGIKLEGIFKEPDRFILLVLIEREQSKIVVDLGIVGRSVAAGLKILARISGVIQLQVSSTSRQVGFRSELRQQLR